MEEEAGDKSFHSPTETIPQSGEIQCVKYTQHICPTLRERGGSEPEGSLSYEPDTDAKTRNSSDAVCAFTVPAV